MSEKKEFRKLKANVSEKKKYICVSIDKFDEIHRKEWQRLWSQSELGNLFNSPDFFEICLKTFKPNKYKLFFCYENGRLCGVLPLFCDRIFGIRAFSSPGRRGNYFDKSIFLVEKNDPKIFGILAGKVLEFGNFLLLEINKETKLMLGSLTPPCVIKWASRSLWTNISEEKNILEFMPKGQKRAMLLRISQKKDDLEFRFFRENLEMAIETVISIEEKSNKPFRFKAFFRKPMSKIFLRNFITQNPDNLRIGILYFQKKPAASVLGFAYDNIFAGYHIAFCKEYGGWGAGKIAIYFMLERLKKEGFKKIDLMRGDSDIKRQFVENAEDQYNVFFSNNYAVRNWWSLGISTVNFLKLVKKFIEKFLFKLVQYFERLNTILNREYKAFLNIMRNSLNYIIFAKRKIKRAGAEKKFLRAAAGKKPIIIFSNYDDRNNPYYAGGGAIAIHEVAKRLSRDFEVHVLTGKYRGCKDQEILDNVHYERIGSSLLGPKLGQLMFHVTLIFSVFKKTFDLWVESFTPPFSTSFLPLFTDKPVIGLVHMLSGEDMRRKYKLPFNLIENLGLKKYVNFIVCTKESGNKIEKINPSAHIEVIPNGISNGFSPGLSSKKHFLYIGRIEMDQKGLDMLLKAYKLIARKNNYPLMIAGAGSDSEEKKLRNLINKLNIYKRVNFVGRISGQEKIKAFQEAAAVIIPSRFETFSLVALEALAYGASVVSFDIEGLKWLPRKYSFKVYPFNIFDLAQVMKRLSVDGRKPEANESEIKNFLKEFDWENIAKKFGIFAKSVIK